jgi:spermidine synthase
MINVAVALWSTFLFANHMSAAARVLHVFCLLILFGQVFAMMNAKTITAAAEGNIYADEIIFARDTHYQHIVLTRFKDDIRLFLNSHLQFSSRDEYRYHEALIHPGLSAVAAPRSCPRRRRRREILKYPEVESVTLVDLDPEMTRLFSSLPMLTAINQKSFLSPRVHVVNADALGRLEHRQL